MNSKDSAFGKLSEHDAALLQPLRLGRQTFPGIWRVMMPEAFQKLRFPDEREANCSHCPKSCYDDWRADYRCCTYHPRISNFLLGLACHTADGSRAVDALIARGMLLPEGMHSSPRQWLDFLADEHHGDFGKSEAVLCPMLDPSSGLCRVHAFRNAVCSSYFCTKDQGHAGEVFWSQIQTLGTQLEMRLAQWALRTIGFDLDASLRALDALAPRLATVSTDQGWQTEALQQVWGTYWGREKELLLACAELIVQHKEDLWSIAQQQSIAEPRIFDAALLELVPAEQRELLDEEDDDWEEVLDLASLWQDCLGAHDALWQMPSGRFVLSPNVTLVDNHRLSAEELYHEAQPFFIEYRFQNPERSLYFRLAISAQQHDLLLAFRAAPLPLNAAGAEAQGFLRDMVHRRVLRGFEDTAGGGKT